MAAQAPSKHSAWPRCRWCHDEIEPVPDGTLITGRETQPWHHVASKSEQCAGRSNHAEPMPALDEDPFMAAAWSFVARHRRLRRAFREVSQSRASAMRRLADYHKLVDDLAAAYESPINDGSLVVTTKALIDYRRSTISAGWR